jgi:hypothetical protein
MSQVEPPVGAGTVPADPLVVDLYKLAVEMVDRTTARRSTANAFYLTAETALVAVLGLNGWALDAAPWWATLTVALAGFLLSVSWWLQLRSYRDLNRAKFQVINAIETGLPVRIFTDEWTLLLRDRIKPWRHRYAELGVVERTVPWIFAGIYVLLYVGQLSA